MTSFIINAHTNRPLPESWKIDGDCPFCKIVRNAAPAYLLYQDDYVAAFLDILPLRPGHTLIVPKIHISRVSELPAEFASAVGIAVSKISAAISKAMNNTGLNVVCNQEYAQAVPHVHYHIIPAPRLGEPIRPEGTRQLAEGVTNMHREEFEARSELDEEEAQDIVDRIKVSL